jgi:hypothetical protein
MRLSRFDKVLGLNRDRIERIYRGGRPLRAVGAAEGGVGPAKVDDGTSGVLGSLGGDSSR